MCFNGDYVDSTASIIDHDLPCVGCGYNLRMQPRDGRCPECATPVAKSLNAFTLDGADPAWCRGTARGLSLLSWVFIAQLFIMLWSFVQRWLIATWGIQTYFKIWFVGAPVQLAVGVAFVFAIRRITRPEPQAPRLARSPRLTARIAAMIFLIMATLSTMAFTWLMLINGFEYPFQQSTVQNDIIDLCSTFCGYGSALSKLIAQLAVLALLWRWFRRGHRLRYRQLVAFLFWLLLGFTLFTWSILAMVIISQRPWPKSAWWLAVQWIYVAIELLRYPLFIAFFVATRAAAATMRRASSTTDGLNGPI